MAEEKDAEKKPGEGEGEGTKAIDEVYQDEVDARGQVDAEDNIKRFVRDRLDEWHNDIETAMDSFDAWCASQTEDQKAHINSGGFFDFISDQYVQSLLGLADGPIMRTLVREINGAITFAGETEHQIDFYTNEAFRRGTRDACWFVRDSTQAILANQWPELVQLATNDSYEFVPALYRLGLPTINFNPAEFAQNMIGAGQSYLDQIGPKQEEVAAKAPADEQPPDDKQAQMQEDAQQDMLEQEEEGKTAAM